MLDPSELKIDVWQSRGPTGPNDAAVKVTHIPTGIVVTRQGTSSVEELRAEVLREVEALVNAESA
jgi:protein subunit release factor A